MGRAHSTKRSIGLQGPIDDAFTDGFLCVQGTKKTWHPATQAYVDKDLARFAFEWSKYMHGDLPIKKDTRGHARTTSPART